MLAYLLARASTYFSSDALSYFWIGSSQL